MVLFDILLVVIVTYIVAKVFGVIIQFIRIVMKFAKPDQPTAGRTARGKSPMPYNNVEDVDYEDITDKK
jgi:hypothetical protein